MTSKDIVTRLRNLLTSYHRNVVAVSPYNPDYKKCEVWMSLADIESLEKAIKVVERSEKKRITGKYDSEHVDEMDNRDAEPIDITDDNAGYHLGFDGEELIHCPHCGCTIPLFNVMPNHYCYVCGGKFGERNLSIDKELGESE